jgi:Domain of unknown function (DUF4232)
MKRHASTLALALLIAAGAVASPRGATNAAACSTSELVVWVVSDAGDATAGSIYLTLGFTNQSGHRCTLTGYAGVSALDLHGKALGRPASREHSRIRAVQLPNGATARARLRIANAQNFPASTCRPRAAAGLRVYPPGQTTSKAEPIPFSACSRTGPVFLSVQALA